jgi:hypothetical protein
MSIIAKSVQRTFVPLALATCAFAAQAQAYQLDLPLKNDSDVVLKEIVRTPQHTKITILLTNTGEEEYGVCSHGPGAPDAFVLRDLDGGAVFKLQSTNGMRNCTKGMDTVKPMQGKIVKMVFPAFPAETRHLQLGERDCQPKPESEMEYWCFNNITLPTN